jgi:hypothetical protein
VKRLNLVDWLLIGTLLPMFIFVVFKSAGSGILHGYYDLPFIFSSAASAESFPILHDVQPLGAGAGLVIGDLALSVNGIDVVATSHSAGSCGSLIGFEGFPSGSNPRGENDRLRFGSRRRGWNRANGQNDQLSRRP